MWKNLKILHICHVRNVRFLHMTDVEKSEIGQGINNVYSLWSFVAFYATSFCKNHFFANYAVLSRNLFCRDLRVFVWRKIEPKIVYVEKKWQISGMTYRFECFKLLWTVIKVNSSLDWIARLCLEMLDCARRARLG